MFCEKGDNIELSILYEAISREEFEDLKSFIHFADNRALDMSDKFAKFLWRNKNLNQLGFSRSFHSIDRQIIPYTGKNSSKERI